LPTYPFERQRYWIDPPPAAIGHPRRSLDDWFSVPVWERSPVPALAGPISGQNWLLLLDEQGVGAAVAEHLRAADQIVTTVSIGCTLGRSGEATYTLDPTSGPDYVALLDELTAAGRVPQRIVHMWSLTSGGVSFEAAFDTAQERGFFSLLHLAEAVYAQQWAEPVSIAIVSNGLHSIAGEAALSPEKASILGAARIIPQEFPGISCRSIDVVVPACAEDRLRAGMMERLAKSLIGEMFTISKNPLVAYRSDERWVQTFASVRLDEANTAARLRDEGVYLIIGEITAKTAALANLIRATARTTVFFLTQKDMSDLDPGQHRPAGNSVNHSQPGQSRRARHFDQPGGEVHIIGGDPGNLEQVSRALRLIDDRFGRLDGVVYCAGAGDDGILLTIRDVVGSSRQPYFRDVRRLRVLEQLLEGRNLDFCIVDSALSAVVGGIGSVVHAAIHSVIDAIVDRQNRVGASRWTCIDWDAFCPDPPLERALYVANVPPPITPQEAAEVYRRALSADALTRLVVSKVDLDARIKQCVEDEASRVGGAANGHRHTRPAISTPYAPPRNELEHQVAGLWEEVLGIEQIGIHDDFFESGGHSLLATQLISWIGKRFPVQLPLRDFFAKPTVAATAARIDELLIAKLDSLSEEQARQLV
jgi:acyl transferase domain-containing protein